MSCRGIQDIVARREGNQLAILDASGQDAIVFARSEHYFATARLSGGVAFDELVAFRERIDQSLRGDARRPSITELNDFGRKLYDILIVGDIRTLFLNLGSANTHVKLHLLSNHSRAQALPWEFLMPPGALPGPYRERSVIRSHLGRCATIFQPVEPATTLRVLLVSAQPPGTTDVRWAEIERLMRTTFQARMPVGLVFDVLRATTVATLHETLADPASPGYHIVHFLGHGELGPDGAGLVKLEDGDLSAVELAQVLTDRGIRMVILSACDTAAGTFASEFSVTAKTLIAGGIPIVLANQLPIPTQSIAPFVGTLYKHLLSAGAGHGDIDRAVAEARMTLSIMLRGNAGEASLEWGIPTLYRTLCAANLFKS